jgi:hypothetical protein
MAVEIKLTPEDKAAIEKELSGGVAGLTSEEKALLQALVNMAKRKSDAGAAWPFEWEAPKAKR